MATTHNITTSRFTGTATCEDCGLLPLDHSDLETLCESEPGIRRYLLQDGNLRVPGGIYGTDTKTCADLAVPVLVILQGETGEPFSFEGVDHLMGLVVNGHPDPGYLMATYGPAYGYDPEDYLDDPTDYLSEGEDL